MLLRVIFSLNIRVQTMDFGRQRRFLLDGEDPPEKVGWRKESYFLEFMNDDVARDFVGVVFNILLDGAKGTHNQRNCCCFEPPHLLKPRFPSLCIYFLIFSVVLTEVLVSRGIAMSMRSQVLSFLFFSTMSGLLAATVPSVWMGMSTQNGDSLGFMLIPSFLHINAKLFAKLPVHVCNCLVVAVDVQPETRLSMVSSKRPHSLPFGSMSGFLRSLNCVVSVPACWEALMLGRDDEALCNCLEASCFWPSVGLVFVQASRTGGPFARRHFSRKFSGHPGRKGGWSFLVGCYLATLVPEGT